MPKSSTLALLDTNVLVYAADTDSRHHAPSRELIARAMIAGSDLAVAPQNLSEFFAIVTDARRVARPVAPLTAIQAIRNLLAMPGLVLLTVPVDVVRRWMQLLEAAPRIGQHAFDLFLVATMLGNGVRRIYTFNANHFQGIVDLEVQVPGSGIFNT